LKCRLCEANLKKLRHETEFSIKKNLRGEDIVEHRLLVELREVLNQLKEKYYSSIDVVFAPSNEGPDK
jgi:hypothetical protein